LFCWVWAGPAIIDPNSIGWISGFDPPMHTIGWWFFRDAPWGWPPGASPNYGLELSNSIALADALPLFALPFKLLDPLLPPQFQYWGLWFLLSFALQGWFGYRLARALNLSPPLALIAAVFCIVYPPFLARLPVHMALGGGHWSILAALYLYARPMPPPRWAWPLLLGVLAAIHGYLLAICGAVWVASLVQRLSLRTARPAAIVIEVAAVLALAFGVLYLVGTFMARTLTAGGYGFYGLNLLSLFNTEGWSALLPDLPYESFESFAFPGIGALILMIATIPVAVRSRKSFVTRRWLPLLVVLAATLIFAITNTINFGPWVLARIPMPDVFYTLAEIFRSSGRMVWPLDYLAIIVALVFAARRWPKCITAIAGVLLAVQIADSAPQWSRFHERGLRAPAWATPLVSPLWNALATRYQRVRAIPVVKTNPHWRDLSYYALTHGMATDAIYLGRVDRDRLTAAHDAGEAAVVTRTYDPGAFYVLDRRHARSVWPSRQPGDLLREVDGLFVFAPGSADLATDLGITAQVEPQPAPLEPGLLVINGDNAGTAVEYLIDGWAGIEGWGVWTEGPVAHFAFHAPGMSGGTLRLNARAYPPAVGQQQIEVTVNGAVVDTWSFPDRDFHNLEIKLPAPLADAIIVGFAIAQPTRPADVEDSSDTRALGLAVTEIELIPPAR
jgi:hypothetical protein